MLTEVYLTEDIELRLRFPQPPTPKDCKQALLALGMSRGMRASFDPANARLATTLALGNPSICSNTESSQRERD